MIWPRYVEIEAIPGPSSSSRPIPTGIFGWQPSRAQFQCFFGIEINGGKRRSTETSEVEAPMSVRRRKMFDRVASNIPFAQLHRSQVEYVVPAAAAAFVC